MRDYRFRGKTINGDWVYGNLSVLRIKSDFNNIQPGHYISNAAGMPFAFQVIPETVGQFITQDQYETDIYEGALFMNGESVRVIEIMGGNTHAITLDRTQSILLSFIIKSNSKNKVIGSIHDK